MRNRITTYGGYFLLFTFYFLLVRCAQIVVPGGGPKDVKPPRVLEYMPDSAATNFNSRGITIVFNEFIQLSDVQKEMTISPPMRILPEVKAKGKTLQIELRDTLKKNTTYVINFGNSIRDFTEGNAKPEFKYIFSTGDKIDTLSMSGQVKNAFDQKSEKGVLVMLYESFDDSVLYKAEPSYFAKTKADGAYKISNIKPGKYKAFALKDANSNYKYDLPAEAIGFSDTLVKISRNAKLDFRIFQEEPKKQLLLKSYASGYGSMLLFYAKPVKNISYKPLSSSTKTETFLTEFNTGRDTVRLWFPVFSKDTLYFKIISDETTIDTIRQGTSQFKKESGGRGEAFKLIAVTNAGKDKPLDLDKKFTIKFNYPIREAKTREIYLSSNGKKIIPADSVMADKVNRSFSFQFPLAQDTVYRLQILPGIFADIFGSANDTIRTEFKIQEEKAYGTLKLSLKLKNKLSYVLELVNEKGVVYKHVKSEEGIFSYVYIPPGAYKLRIVYDQNKDGKWTTGNYLEKRKPETVIYYPGAVTIRSNWDLELDWNVE